MVNFNGLREKIRDKIPEGVRQKLLAMSEEGQSTAISTEVTTEETDVGEPVHAINVNEKSVVVPNDDITTIDIDSVPAPKVKVEPKKKVVSTEPKVDIIKDRDEDIQYTIASDVTKSPVIDADYQIPYGKEPFLSQDQIVDIIKITGISSLAINFIFAILNVGFIPCILLLVIVILIYVFLIQEYHHPTYI